MHAPETSLSEISKEDMVRKEESNPHPLQAPPPGTPTFYRPCFSQDRIIRDANHKTQAMASSFLRLLFVIRIPDKSKFSPGM